MGKHIEMIQRFILRDGKVSWEIDGQAVGDPIDLRGDPADAARIVQDWQHQTSGFTESTMANFTLTMFEGLRQVQATIAEDGVDAEQVKRIFDWRGTVTVTMEAWGPDDPPREPPSSPIGGIGVPVPGERVISRSRWAKQPDGTWAEAEKLPV